MNLESGCTKSEMHSKFYEEVLGVVDGEIKLQKANRLRKLSGRQQIDYHVENPGVSSFADVLFRSPKQKSRLFP